VSGAERLGIRLDIAFGQAEALESPRSVAYARLPSAIPVRNLRITPFSAVWQCAPSPAPYDLVIVEQANRLLVNYALMLRRNFVGRPPRLAYWAHGVNWQGRPNSLRERWKRLMRAQADFWFCYTDRVVQTLADVPAERKCSIDNAIDTRALSAAIADASRTIPKDPLHLVFIGSMRRDKRLDWIFDTLDFAHAHIPGVTAAFIGDGPEATSVRLFCAQRPWATALGPLHGRETAPHLQRAGAILMPGLVGLVVLDSFVAQAPLLTTPYNGCHSPEFAYAEPAVNALVSRDDRAAYRQMVLGYLQDPGLADRLRSGCQAAAGRYTIANMAGRFVDGVQSALMLPTRRKRLN
jgi:glycosyltransferase involved in cell wall biosynthesis